MTYKQVMNATNYIKNLLQVIYTLWVFGTLSKPGFCDVRVQMDQ